MKFSNMFWPHAAVVLTAAGALAACGGGGGGRNAAPALGAIADQSVDQDTSTAALAVTVSDDQTPAEKLQITLASSDQAVIPMSGLVLSGNGAARTLTVTPSMGATGSATVSLVVIDAAGAQTVGSFKVTVNPVLAQFSALAVDLFASGETGDPKRVDNVTFTFDVNENPDAFNALFQ